MTAEGEELPELEVPDAASGGATLAGALGERYQALARLGTGAFGEVYRAHDRLLGRDVAIKRIRLEALADPDHLEEVKQRFLREAQVAARLRHPNIVTTHDIVSSPAMSFIVMELVEGETLQALLQARGRLPLDETIRLLGQVAAALDHAHAQGIVHRDVKPANIMIEPSGHVKVMDFGIAKLESGANLTSSGLIMGTPNYMSPEQARGERVDARSDLFALGCVLHECLSGTKPFAAASVAAILVRILTESPPPVDFEATGLPRGLGPVLQRATAKEPAQRFASGAELVEALRALAATGAAAAAGAGLAPGPSSALPGPTPRSAPQDARGAPTRVSKIPAPAASAGGRRVHRLLVALGLVAGLAWLAVTLAPARPAARDASRLVVEEDVGFLGRLFGREPRLIVTVREGTALRLALEAPLSSETAVTGNRIAAETTSPVRVEGTEAIPVGSRLLGRVTYAASAEQKGGRGEMTLEFESLQLADGGGLRLRTKPLGLRAPAARRKDNAFVQGLSEVGAAVGELIGGRRGAAAGTAFGGSAGTVIVTTSEGREVALGARAPMSVELAEPITLTRARQP